VGHVQVVTGGALRERVGLLVDLEVDVAEGVDAGGGLVGVGAGTRLVLAQQLFGVVPLAVVVDELDLTAVELEGLVEVVDDLLGVAPDGVVALATRSLDLGIGSLGVGAVGVRGVPDGNGDRARRHPVVSRPPVVAGELGLARRRVLGEGQLVDTRLAREPAASDARADLDSAYSRTGGGTGG